MLNRFAAVAFAAAVLLVSPGLAAPASAAPALTDCLCSADRSALAARHAAIAEATDPAEARALALEDIDATLGVLRRARWIAPGSEDLRAAQAKLTRYRADVLAAATPVQASERFAELVRLDIGLDTASIGADIDVDIDEPSCHFTTGELIAIVLGFILGIIPGLILLVLLC